MWPGSFLDEVRGLAEWLAGRVGWGVEEAAWALLTGEAPITPAIGVAFAAPRNPSYTLPARTVITLQVQPWVSPESVAESYRLAQSAMVRPSRRKAAAGEGPGKEARPRAGRPFDEKTLAMFEFVSTRRAEGSRHTWPELWVQWNAAALETGQEKWRYTHPKRMHEAYTALEATLQPPGVQQLATDSPENFPDLEGSRPTLASEW